jgi:hypothetical protein
MDFFSRSRACSITISAAIAESPPASAEPLDVGGRTTRIKTMSAENRLAISIA